MSCGTALPVPRAEIVFIYIDTKIIKPVTPEQITKGNKDITRVFGDMLWSVQDGSPLQQTVSHLLAAGKRVVIENVDPAWLAPSEGQALVFAPTLWTHQFDSADMTEFPNCTG